MLTHNEVGKLSLPLPNYVERPHVFGCWVGSGAWKVLSVILGKISDGDFSRTVNLVNS